jgi:hypothetical protein
MHTQTNQVLLLVTSGQMTAARRVARLSVQEIAASQPWLVRSAGNSKFEFRGNAGIWDT